MTPEEMRLNDQLRELKERLHDLAHENAELRVQRDIARAQVYSLLPKATPEQEEELRQQMAGPLLNFSDVIAELTCEFRGKNGNT